MKFYFFCFVLFFSVGCEADTRGFICKSKKSSKRVVFNYGISPYKYVDIGASPTVSDEADNEYIKKFFIEKDKGFLIVETWFAQTCDCSTGICKNCKNEERFDAIRYTKDKGYEEWRSISEKEWKQITSIDHIFPRKPDFHYEKCRRSIFSKPLQLIQIYLTI